MFFLSLCPESLVTGHLKALTEMTVTLWCVTGRTCAVTHHTAAAAAGSSESVPQIKCLEVMQPGTSLLLWRTLVSMLVKNLLSKSKHFNRVFNYTDA